MPYDTSFISFLPFVDLPAHDLDCINTGIHYARDKIQETKQKVTLVTFDLPLYLKAKDIICNSSLTDVVIRLGGFHTLMSYLGCIGYIMSGSGLSELLTLIYAPNPLEKVLSGHAYARAVRAHMLVQQALATFIFSDIEFTSEEEDEILLLTNSIPPLNETNNSAILQGLFQKWKLHCCS